MRLQSIIQEKNNAMPIRQGASFIPYVTRKLGRIHRNYEANFRADEFIKDDFVLLLKSQLKNYNFDISIELMDQDSNSYELYLNKGDNSISFSTLSTGEKEMLNIILGIIGLNIESGIMIIDEPEMHLHPEWQTQLLFALMDIAESRRIQILFATHSSNFITPKNLLNVYRIYMNKDLASKVVSLKPELIERQFKNFYRIINATNNNILFFCSKIILVEGITDKMIVDAILEKEFANECKANDISVMVLGSKTCLKLYIDLLENLNINWCFMGDLDNMNELSNSEILKGSKNIDKQALNKSIFNEASSSKDAKSLYEELKEAIANNNMDSLKKFVVYLENRFSKWDEKQINSPEILNEIKTLKHEGYFLLPRGDIENYFLEKYKKQKSISLIDEMLSNQMEEWRETEYYNDLKKLTGEMILRLCE